MYDVWRAVYDSPVAFSESSQTFLTLETPDFDWECPGHLSNLNLRFAVVEDPELPAKRVLGEILPEDILPIVNVIYNPALADDDVVIRVDE